MTQSDDATTRSTSSAIMEEHATIRTLMERVGTTTNTAELHGVLIEFHSVAKPHFESEESPDGFFESVLASSARYDRELAKLREEHVAFLTDMERLATRCADEGGGFDALREGADELVDRLRAHESTENQLVMEVFNTDLGAGD